MPTTIDDLVTFVKAHQGYTFHTTKQTRAFSVRMKGDAFEYTLSSGSLYKQPRSDMEMLLQQYNETGSLRPSDYHHPNHHGSRFSSYFAALMTAKQQTP